MTQAVNAVAHTRPPVTTPLSPLSPSWRQANALVARRLAERIAAVAMHHDMAVTVEFAAREIALHLDAARGGRDAR